MASITVDELKTRITVDASQYKRETGDVERSTRGMDSAFSAVKMGIGAVVGALAVAAAAVTAFLGTVGAVSISLIRRAAEFDSLVRSLEAVTGSAAEAKRQLAELRQIAQAPGIGFEESIMGYTRLRRAGVDDADTKRMLREIGNLTALAGGGPEMFNRLTTVFMQIRSKPFLQGEELLQLMEAGVPVQQQMLAAFGTMDTMALKKQGITSTQILDGLLKEFEKMDRVAGGFQNTLDNLGIAWKQAQVDIGTGLARNLLPVVEQVSDALSELSASGFLGAFGQALGQTFADMLGVDRAALQRDAMTAILKNIAVNTLAWAMRIEDFLAKFGDAESPVAQLAVRLGAMHLFTQAALGNEEAAARLDRYRDRVTNTGETMTVQEGFQELAESALRSLMEDAGLDFDAMGKLSTRPTADQEDPIGQDNSDTLKEIADNTRPLRNLTRTVLGGAELGRLGVTAVDVARLRRPHAVVR